MRQAVIGVIVGVGAVAGAGFFPGAAGAATAFVTNREGVPASITYAAEPGERNEVAITSDGSGIYDIKDAGAVITAGAGCTAVSPHEVTCDARAYAFVRLVVFAGDRNDSVDAREVVSTAVHRAASTLWGREGKDLLLGSAGCDFLDGGPDNDVLRGRSSGPWRMCGNILRGRSGDDVLVGGPSRDDLNGGPGADMLDGRGGRDTAYYTSSRRPVVVTLDDRPNDGRAREKDNVRGNVEGVIGTRYDDRLVGNGGVNYLDGFFGDDVLHGRGGRDSLGGGVGEDILRPGRGRDKVQGGPQNDTIYARDGARDHLSGDGNRDRARIDLVDVVEYVERLF